MFRSNLAALVLLLTCAFSGSLHAQPVNVALTASPPSGTVPLTTTVSATAQWSHLPSRNMLIHCSNGHVFQQAAFHEERCEATRARSIVESLRNVLR